MIDEVKEYESYLQLFRTNKDGTPINDSAFENTQLLDTKGQVTLLSLVVPCVFSKNDTENYYKDNCSRFCNNHIHYNYLD